MQGSLLWIAAFEQGYADPRWMTYKQAENLGANVIKGQKGTRIVIAKDFIPKEEKQRAEEKNRDPIAAAFLKYHTVFNISQIENLHDTIEPVQPKEPVDLPQRVEAIQAGSDINVQIGGNRAFYVPSMDLIQLPNPDQFDEPEEFDRTFFHEMIHATGHETRLNRKLTGQKHRAAYAREELIAEMGAAFIAGSFGIEATLRHAEYINTWLELLKDDKRAIFTAASAATKAANFVLEYAEKGMGHSNSANHQAYAACWLNRLVRTNSVRF